MKHTWVAITLLLVLCACDSNGSGNGEAGSGGDAGSSGESGSGGDAGSGGSAGDLADAGEIDCAGLREDMFVLLQMAAECDPANHGCTGNSLVQNVCGCDQVVNDDSPFAEAARSAAEAGIEHCGTPGCADVECPATTPAECADRGDGLGYRCRAVEE